MDKDLYVLSNGEGYIYHEPDEPDHHIWTEPKLADVAAQLMHEEGTYDEGDAFRGHLYKLVEVDHDFTYKPKGKRND
jgi:hypothetical protein